MNTSQRAIDWINSKAASWTIFGWLAGCSWVSWQGQASDISTAWWLVIVVVGIFGSSLIVGGGISLLIAALCKISTGRADGAPLVFALGVIVSPILAFVAALIIGNILQV